MFKQDFFNLLKQPKGTITADDVDKQIQIFQLSGCGLDVLDENVASLSGVVTKTNFPRSHRIR